MGTRREFLEDLDRRVERADFCLLRRALAAASGSTVVGTGVEGVGRVGQREGRFYQVELVGFLDNRRRATEERGVQHGHPMSDTRLELSNRQWDERGSNLGEKSKQ